MTLRDNCTPEQLRAHRILDEVRAELPVPLSRIRWALIVLGDGV